MSSMSPVRAREFWSDTVRLFDLSAAKRDEDALAVAIDISERFPEQSAETSYLLACAYNRAGHQEQALRALEAALNADTCWHDSLLLLSPSLKPLRNLPRFQEILARSKAMMDELEADTTVNVTVFVPATEPAAPPGLFLPLHGGADIPHQHDAYWATAAGVGLLVAIPQSSQRRSSDTFWWGASAEAFERERSEQDIQTAYNETRRGHAFDDERVVLGGFSQGATVAVTLALQNRPFPILGFACVGPAVNDLESLVPLMEPAAARGMRGWILAGERERGRPQISRFFEELISHGVPCQLDIVEGLGHEFPDDFGARLQSGLRFVLG